jgi:hypothetical protein
VDISRSSCITPVLGLLLRARAVTPIDLDPFLPVPLYTLRHGSLSAQLPFLPARLLDMIVR